MIFGESSVSSAKLFVVMISISFAVILSDTILSKDQQDTSIKPIQMIQMIYMLIGLAVMTIFMVFENQALSRNAFSGVIEYKIDSILIAVGLVLFSGLSAIFECVYLVTTFNCLEVFKLCPGGTYSSHVTNVLFMILRIVYFVSETIFFLFFRHARFHRNGKSRNGLVILQAVNLTLWFDILVFESSYRIDQPFFWHVDEECSQMFSNDTTKFHCVDRNITLHQTMREYPHGYPFLYEFTILVGERLMFWILQCDAQDDSSNTLLPGLPCDSMDERSSIGSSHLSRSSPALPFEGNSQNSDTFEEISKQHLPDDNESNEQIPLLGRFNKCHLTFPWKLSIIASLVVNSGYGITYVLLGEFASAEYKRFVFMYAIVYWALMIALIVIGYHVLRDVSPANERCDKYHVLRDVGLSSANERCDKYHVLRDANGEFHGLRNLLILSSIGQFVRRTLSFLAFTGNLKMGETAFEECNSVSALIYCLLEGLIWIYVYLHISFCLLVDRMASRMREQSANRIALFKFITIHVAMVSMAQWIALSFCDYKHPVNYTNQKSYFGDTNWMLAMNALLPIEVYFWFNSCLINLKSFAIAHITK